MIIRYTLIITIIVATVLTVWLLFFKSPPTPDVTNEPIVSEWANLYEIQNQTDKSELESTTRDLYATFSSQNAGLEGWQTFTKGAKQVPTQIGLSALGVQVPTEMEPVLNSADWGIHSCKSTLEKPKFVLRLLFALGTQGELVTYAGKLDLLKKWETTMLPDVQKVIFPEKFYGTSLSVANGFVSSDVVNVSGLRKTEIVNGENTISEFGYVVVGDHLLIGNDINCMNTIAGNILGVVP
jgi:hypothetical protein